MTDKIKVIAEYDGWKVTERKHIMHDYGFLYSKKIKSNKRPREAFFHEIEHSYLTDLNTLHPVAMRVLDELEKKDFFILTNPEIFGDNIKYSRISVKKCKSALFIACCTKPNPSGQYIALVEAVYHGILLLNELKEKCSPHK